MPTTLSYRNRFRRFSAQVKTAEAVERASASATTGNNYVTVWNNASVDGNFGVTETLGLGDPARAGDDRERELDAGERGDLEHCLSLVGVCS